MDLFIERGKKKERGRGGRREAKERKGKKGWRKEGRLAYCHLE